MPTRIPKRWSETGTAAKDGDIGSRAAPQGEREQIARVAYPSQSSIGLRD